MNKDNEKQEIKRLKRLIVALFVMVTILFVWLSYACWCDLKFGSESSAGSLMTALGIMVTALVGWQVFNAIEMRDAIKTMKDLNTEVTEKISKLKSRDDELKNLIEAYFLASLFRDRSHGLGSQYSRCGQAIRYFLLAGVSCDYESLVDLVEQLPNILDELDKQDRIGKEFFSDNHRIYEVLSKEIIEILDKRPKEYESIKAKIIQSRDRRRKITETHIDVTMKRSLEKEEAILHPFKHINWSNN